ANARNSTNFVLHAGADPSQGDARPVLLIGGGPAVDPFPLRVQFAGADTLILDQGCCDQFAFTYVRTTPRVGANRASDPEPRHELLESRFTPQRVEHRIDLGVHQPAAPVVERVLDPLERRTEVTQAQ